MKKIIFVAACTVLFACNNNSGESGVVNDGIQPLDSNGALSDTTGNNTNPGIDTSKDENRVDIEKRDTLRQ